jgi:hypothetical protein
MGGGSIPVVADGCGVGGTVAWTYTVHPPFGAPVMNTFQVNGMAAGPMGHVAVGSVVSANHSACDASSVILDASGVSVAGAPGSSFNDSGACMASVNPVGFDPSDHLFYGYEYQASVPGGSATSGFHGENASVSVMGNTSMGPLVYPSFMGADAAGNLFALVNISPNPTNLGLGPVQGTVMLHYDPSGALVSDTLPTAGKHAVGALGGLFSATQVTGTLDDGCGTVGTAGAASTILTKRNGAGTCLWSKALPPNVVFGVDPMENVLLGITFSGTIDFGGGPLTSAGTSDLAIAKLDASGAHLWSKRFGAAGSSVSGISALGAVNDGGVALSVGFGGAVDFGCGTVSSAGGDVILAKFDATGTVVYSRAVLLLDGYGGNAAGPVVDGLGGISYAAQVKYDCSCMNIAQCPIGDQCLGGTCLSCTQAGYIPGNILISRFAP